VILFRGIFRAIIGLLLGSTATALAQIDPYPRSLLQLGYDQSLSGQGPQSLYVYYYYNNPAFRRTNVALRLAVAPVYFDGELGFRQLSPQHRPGHRLEWRCLWRKLLRGAPGDYVKGESFDGHGGGASLNLYHRMNPAQFIPLNLVLKAGGPLLNLFRCGQDGAAIPTAGRSGESLRARGGCGSRARSRCFTPIWRWRCPSGTNANGAG
jgi:hypothetical protein